MVVRWTFLSLSLSLLLSQADGGVLLRRLGGGDGSGAAADGCSLRVHYTGRLVGSAVDAAGKAAAPRVVLFASVILLIMCK